MQHIRTYVSMQQLHNQQNPFHADKNASEIGAIILKITYGYTTSTGISDPLVELADTCVKDIGEAAQVGAWLVDLIPARK